MPLPRFLPCLLLCALGFRAFALPLPAQSAHDLVKDMVYNELQDRERKSFWQYRIEKTTGQLTLTEQQVETPEGPIFRILARNGKPLDAAQQQHEAKRLQGLLQDPAEQAKVKQKHEEDEQRLERLMRFMPDAFLFDYDGNGDGDSVALNFRPNPAFNPPTYETRVFHALAGKVWIDLSQKRLQHLQGQIMERVDFGYGLLGHIEKGGTFEFKRQPVSATHWKTTYVDVHLTGRLVFFKTIDKDEREVRTQFEQSPSDLTLEQAERLLEKST